MLKPALTILTRTFRTRWIQTFVAIALLISAIAQARADAPAEHALLSSAGGNRPAIRAAPAGIAPGGVSHAPDRPPASDAPGREPVAAGPRSVLGPDERVQISPAVSVVAMLESISDDEESIFLCTGTFIAPDVLITAAHCLYGDDLGGWASNIWVTPGADGDGNYPFGYELAENYWVPDGWYDAQTDIWDYGLILMSDTGLGNATGWLEVDVLQTDSLFASDFDPIIVGYPGDKPYATQWAGTKPAFYDVDADWLYHEIDTAPGQSGSAVLRGSDYALVGIHAYGGEEINYANRIDSSMLDDLLSGCEDMECEFAWWIEPSPSPTATSTPTETSTSATVTATLPSGGAFDAVWNTTDAAVAAGQAAYSWFWGPGPNVEEPEPYAQSPEGRRLVRYYDKSRMEITHPDGDPSSIWYVTNGLLTEELVSGHLQTGDATWEQRPPSQQLVAGDPFGNPGTPSYAAFAPWVTTDGLSNRSPDRTNQDVLGFMSGNGQLGTTDSGGVTYASYQGATGHNIASVFWAWANSPSSGLRPDQGIDWLYVLGYPISEPYWIDATVAGTQRRVLVQLFERRVLTYTPGNPAQFQVEFGNIGQHYWRWRYGSASAPQFGYG